MVITSRGKRIELIRTVLHMKQSIFAKKIGVSIRALQYRESDKSEVLLNELEKMVEMGANPEFLLTGKGSILREGFQRGSS